MKETAAGSKWVWCSARHNGFQHDIYADGRRGHCCPAGARAACGCIAVLLRPRSGQQAMPACARCHQHQILRCCVGLERCASWSLLNACLPWKQTKCGQLKREEDNLNDRACEAVVKRANCESCACAGAVHSAADMAVCGAQSARQATSWPSRRTGQGCLPCVTRSAWRS